MFTSSNLQILEYDDTAAPSIILISLKLLSKCTLAVWKEESHVVCIYPG